MSDPDASPPCPTVLLLGRPRFGHLPLSAAALDRKAAALLAYLALEGETSRGLLAGLLWPQRRESTARNNLAQCLRRLSPAGGMALVIGRDRLALEREVRVDILEVLRLHRDGDWKGLLDRCLDLLSGLDFDECTDFTAWLRAQRERLQRMREEALERLAEAAEDAGQFRAALDYARKLVESDAWSEAGHRRLMRLFALTADHAAAIAAYERCRAVLAGELGVQPSEETQRLYREICAASQQRSVGPNLLVERRMPFGLMRPPRFVGRQGELARMDEAWRQGKAIFLSGEAGLGKTRLMQAFFADQGRCHLFEGQPEDVNAPYATYSRTLRQVMGAFPHLTYPDWVMREAARILPETGAGIGVPVDDAERLRFHDALAEANDIAVRAGMRRVAVDDLHLVDDASLMVGHHVYARQWGRVDGMRTIMLFRPEEFSEEGRQALYRVLDRGIGMEIRLEPLSQKDVAELLEGIDPTWADWSDRLYAHCGGNPYFILETLRALHARDQLTGALPRELPVAPGVRALLQRRLSGLDDPSLTLARLAAIAPRPLDIESATRALACPPLALLESWSRLESRGILRQGAVTHGAWRHLLLDSIPVQVVEHLRRQIPV